MSWLVIQRMMDEKVIRHKTVCEKSCSVWWAIMMPLQSWSATAGSGTQIKSKCKQSELSLMVEKVFHVSQSKKKKINRNPHNNCLLHENVGSNFKIYIFFNDQSVTLFVTWVTTLRWSVDDFNKCQKVDFIKVQTLKSRVVSIKGQALLSCVQKRIECQI